VSVYAANVVLALHFALILFANSTFLEESFSNTAISLLYAGGSILSVFIFLLIPHIIERFTIFTTALFFILCEFISIGGMAVAGNPVILATLFVLHTALISILFYICDVYLEKSTKEEVVTGSTRGTYLTLTNIAFMIAPLLTGIIVSVYGYRYVYACSALLLFPLLYMFIKWLRPIRSESEVLVPTNIPKDTTISIRNKKIFYPLFAQIVLQFFFAFMVIYLPIYLITEIGFTWKILGPIFTIMLLPYVLFELPVGYLADSRYGEKEFMIGGFLLIAATMVAITLPETPHAILWSVLLFLSRVGASFAEITTETNFFRQVDGSDEGIISLFRLSRPLAYVLAAIVGTISLAYLPFTALFLVLAGIILVGVIVLLPMKDSR